VHIPDGYLSPVTAGAMYVVSTPFWVVAVQRVRKALNRRTVPALAMFSAFAFIVMMFNIPLPGGTTGHAVGGTVLAIVLGPWTAVIGVSVVLAIQALLFGDGGLTAFGANCFNMAVVLPWTGYFIYKVISGKSEVSSKRRLVGAVAGSYIAILAASLLTGIELGIQPFMAHAADGTPLYAPYGLNIALPIMAIGHLAVAGPVEAIVTGLVFFYLQKSHSNLLEKSEGPQRQGKLWIVWSAALVLLALATPLGLLAAGTAWGEWGADELKEMLGYVPKGMEDMGNFWKAPLPDYTIPGVGDVTGYILSALIGLVIVGLLVWAIARWIGRKNNSGNKPSAKGESVA
jgi:cobalt/nickel transport system permease protein